MNVRTISLVAAAICLAAVVAVAEGSREGYLPVDRAPRTLAILPAAPVDGSPLDIADRAIFRQTRALENTPRWRLAQNDVDASPRAMLRDFSCAVGVTLDPAKVPKLAALLSHLGPDVAQAVNPPKDFYRRKRPYLVAEGAICVPRSAALDANWDYPSGHAAWGWTVGVVLAELAPDRTTPILARARAFGESRAVCGVHNASAVAAGRLAAMALNAALNGDAAFRSDMEAARQELAALRATGSGPPGGACAAEAALAAKAPW